MQIVELLWALAGDEGAGKDLLPQARHLGAAVG